ncbi:MAG: acyltransferase [Oscillospiraceae bacterium]|nr:acyltransferase [Oscillospiraceae bacterium]
MDPRETRNIVSGNTRRERNSNLELYRIITMLLIVAHHYVVNSGLTSIDGPIYSNITSWRSIFLLLFGAWGKTGINCFVLISGYFMCKSNITFKKLLKLLLEVYFYRIIINGLFWISGYEAFSLETLVKTIVPFTSIAQNFTGCYFVFLLVIPFLNILIRNMTQRQHILLVLLTAGVYVIFGSVPFFSVTFNYITWYCVLYFIAAYIRLYPKKIFDNTKLWGQTSLIMLGIASVSVVVCAIIPPMFGRPSLPYLFVADSNKILAVAVAVSSFMFFKNIPIKTNRFINSVSATTFGILLIHANSDSMRRWLWQDVLNNKAACDSPYMLIHAIGSVVAIFTLCFLIDYCRIKWIETPFFNCWEYHGAKIEAKGKRIVNKIFDKLSKE